MIAVATDWVMKGISLGVVGDGFDCKERRAKKKIDAHGAVQADKLLVNYKHTLDMHIFSPHTYPDHRAFDTLALSVRSYASTTRTPKMCAIVSINFARPRRAPHARYPTAPQTACDDI